MQTSRDKFTGGSWTLFCLKLLGNSVQQSRYYLRPPDFAVTRGAALLLAMGRDRDNFLPGKVEEKENPNEGKGMEVTIPTEQLQSTITTFRIL